MSNNSNLTAISRVLRSNMTKEERHLWYDFLRNLPQKFYRQKKIGRYIVDFYCAECSVVIELDGSQHYERDGELADRERDDYLRANGISVLLFSNLQINTQFDNVCQEIFNVLNKIC